MSFQLPSCSKIDVESTKPVERNLTKSIRMPWKMKWFATSSAKWVWTAIVNKTEWERKHRTNSIPKRSINLGRIFLYHSDWVRGSLHMPKRKRSIEMKMVLAAKVKLVICVQHCRRMPLRHTTLPHYVGLIINLFIGMANGQFHCILANAKSMR